MSFLKSNFFLFFILSSINIYAQRDTIYADENDNLITKEIFNKKINSPIYIGLRFETDTLVLQKIKFNYYFGKLSTTNKNQLFKLLNKRHQIDTTKTLIIHYIDTLKSGKKLPKLKRELIRSYKVFIIETTSSIRNYKKFREFAQVLHFYNYNIGQTNEIKNLKFYKDYGLVIMKMFSDSDYIYDKIIIYPNGEFYVFSNFPNVPYGDLVRKTNWDLYKNEFLKEIELLSTY